MTAHSNETIDNEIVEDDEEVNISSTSSPVESIASPSTNALSTIAEYESDEGEQDDDLLSLKSGILEDDNFEDESEGGRRRSRRESGRKVKRNRSGMRRNSLMKKRIANAHEHLRDSEEMAKKQMKDRMAKRLNQRKTKDGSNEQDNHGRVVHVPSTTAIDEDANIANSILYDGNGDGDTTRADGTQVRTVQSATKAVPRNTFIPATRRSTLNKSKTPKRRVSGVVRDMKKKVANAEVEHEDELNRNKANRFERM